MTRIRLAELTRSISFKLLAGLFLLLGLSIATSLFGLWTFERDRYTEIAREEAMRAAQVVERSLRHAMLDNDWEMVRQTVAHIHQIVEPAGISILDVDGRRLVAGDEQLVGQQFERDDNPECIVCHQHPEALPNRTVVLMEIDSQPMLRNVIKITNEPACHACHDPHQRILGVFIYDVPFGEIIAMLRTVLTRTVLTGLITFLLMSVVLTLLVRRYVHRPLQQLGEGFIKVGRGDLDHWVEVDVDGEVRDMADQFNVMSQAIKRSFAELKRKHWETEQLYTFVRHLSQFTEWRQLRRVITDMLAETFRAEKAALLLRREKGEKVVVDISWRIAGDRRYHHREVEDPEQAADLPNWLREAWRDWRAQPQLEVAYNPAGNLALAALKSQNFPLGMLCLVRQADSPFNSVGKKLLSALVEQIETALANARLYRLAITDGLTGLYGKRYCESMIRKFIEAHEDDPNQVFAVLMLDLDFFKAVNDTHGHQVGDEVLIQLADLIRAQIRHEDVACRYGGEEFIILVSGGIQAGRKIAERMVRVVGGAPFRCDGGLELQITISVGVAAFPDHGSTAAEVVGAADQALYRAKDTGRNRYETAGEAEREGPQLAG